jgi:hypothetical protein
LIELLVVVAIIALLIAILLPTLTEARKLSRVVVCASNQRQIGTGMFMYAQEHKLLLPYAGNLYDRRVIRYDIYRLTNTGSSPGYREFGLLDKAKLLDAQTDVFFCPLMTNTGHLNPQGDPTAGSNYVVPLPTHSSKTWLPTRAGFIRRYLGEQSDFDSARLTDIGNKAFVADVLRIQASPPVNNLLQSHGDSVNVVGGDGAVSLIKCSPTNPDDDLQTWLTNTGTGAALDPVLDRLWEYFDRNR